MPIEVLNVLRPSQQSVMPKDDPFGKNHPRSATDILWLLHSDMYENKTATPLQASGWHWENERILEDIKFCGHDSCRSMGITQRFTVTIPQLSLTCLQQIQLLQHAHRSAECFETQSAKCDAKG